MENISNLKELLNRTAEKYQDKIAYKTEEKTYKDFINDVNALGTKLIDMGLKNKKIAILSENRYEWELAYFAISCGTGIVVPLDKAMPKSEVERIVKNANIDAIFYSNTYTEKIENLEICKISMDKDIYDLVDQGKSLIANGNVEFTEVEIKNDETSFIYYTSGTTDKSKAVMLSHENICSNLNAYANKLEISLEDRALVVLPLHHVLEGIFGMLNSIYHGMTRVYCNDLKEVLNDIVEHKITFMCGVPSLYEHILNELETCVESKKIANQINMFFTGGAPLNPKTKEQYRNLGINLIQGYGLTETAPVIAIETKNNQKDGSVGKIISNIEYKLENVNDEQIGELWVKGSNVMKGYYNNIEETKKVLLDGWFNTGDLAKIEEGYLFISGRNKDVIVLKNGKKVFPNELQELLQNIDGCKECIVYGDNIVNAKIVYDEKFFEEKSLEEIETYFKEKIKEVNMKLPEYKVISKYILSNEMIEKNETGKINKRKEIQKLNDKNDKILQIIKEQIDSDEVKVEDDLVYDLGMDSLDILETISKVEKEFDIKITKEQRKDIHKVEDIGKYV